MLAPETVGRREVMYPRQVLELVDRSLAGRDAELVLELAGRSNTYAELVLLDLLLFEVVEGVRATSVRPHVREGDLLGGTLLQEQLAVARTEDERGKRAVEKTFVDVLHQVACEEVGGKFYEAGREAS